LTSAAGERWVTQAVKVPRAARHEGSLLVEGGSRTWNDALYEADTVEDVEKALEADVRNDEILATLSFWSRRREAHTQGVSEPQDLVVTGHRGAGVIVGR
jgi:hypothetical protein